MREKHTGLGRGLSALIDDPAAKCVKVSDGEAAQIEIAKIRPNPKQPRSNFDPDTLAELTMSVADRGVLQPILLRPSGEYFEIVAGERRWRAARNAGLKTIPAMVREFDDSTTAEVALIENVQREDLNPIEEAEAYRELLVDHGYTQEGIGKLVRKSRSHVANLLRLLGLPVSVRHALATGVLSMGHARAIAASADPDCLARQVMARKLTVRQAEALAKQAKVQQGDGNRGDGDRGLDPDLVYLQQQLTDKLGLKVGIVYSSGKGAVRISYRGLDQLDFLCQRLSGESF